VNLQSWNAWRIKPYLPVLYCFINQLEPHINGPFTPDLANPISKIGQEAKKKGWPVEIKAGL